MPFETCIHVPLGHGETPVDCIVEHAIKVWGAIDAKASQLILSQPCYCLCDDQVVVSDQADPINDTTIVIYVAAISALQHTVEETKTP